MHMYAIDTATSQLVDGLAWMREQWTGQPVPVHGAACRRGSALEFHTLGCWIRPWHGLCCCCMGNVHMLEARSDGGCFVDDWFQMLRRRACGPGYQNSAKHRCSAAFPTKNAEPDRKTADFGRFLDVFHLLQPAPHHPCTAPAGQPAQRAQSLPRKS